MAAQRLSNASNGHKSGHASDSPQPSNMALHGRRKKSPAVKVQGLWALILEYLETEWKNTCSLNLGIKSGTGIVTDLLMRKTQEWIEELHALVVASDPAADAFASLAQKLSKDQLQQLQVMFDVMGHEVLSDYLRLTVYHTTRLLVDTPILGPDKAALRAARHSRSLSRARRTVAQGATAAQADAPPVPRPARDEFIRFAGFLPSEHPLVQRAYRLYLTRQPPDPEPPLPASSEPTAEQLMHTMRTLGYGTGQSIREERESLKLAQQKAEAAVPIWTDVQSHWRERTHTVLKEDLIGQLTMIGQAVPLYTSMPEFKRSFLEQAEAAPLTPAGPSVQYELPQVRHEVATLGTALPMSRRASRPIALDSTSGAEPGTPLRSPQASSASPKPGSQGRGALHRAPAGDALLAGPGTPAHGALGLPSPGLPSGGASRFKMEAAVSGA